MKIKRTMKVAIVMAVFAVCFAVFAVSNLYAGTKMYYHYPISFYDQTFYRNLSNHDSYTISVKKNTGDYDSTQYGIKSFWSGYGSEITKVLNLETGVISKTAKNLSNNNITVTNLQPPKNGGDKKPYLDLLREIKSDVEYVEMGRGSTMNPDFDQLRNTNQYLSAVLLEIEKPAQEELSYWFMDLNNSLYCYIPDNFHPGMKVNLKLKYKAVKDRDILADFFVDNKYVTGIRIAAHAGEDTVKGTLTIPQNVSVSDNAVIYFKLVPKGEPWNNKLLETSVNVKVKGAYTIDDFYAYKDSSAESINYGLHYFISKNMDVRIDLRDDKGKLLWTKQNTAKYQNEGFGELYDRISGIEGLVRNANYKLTVKILPVGAGSGAVAESTVDFQYQ